MSTLTLAGRIAYVFENAGISDWKQVIAILADVRELERRAQAAPPTVPADVMEAMKTCAEGIQAFCGFARDKERSDGYKSAQIVLDWLKSIGGAR